MVYGINTEYWVDIFIFMMMDGEWERRGEREEKKERREEDGGCLAA